MVGLGLEKREPEASERPNARWRSRIAIALVAIVVVVVGVSIYRSQSDSASESDLPVIEAPLTTDCSTSAQPPAVDTAVVSRILQAVGEPADVAKADNGCGSYTVDASFGNAGHAVVIYSRSWAPPTNDPPATATDEVIAVWIEQGQPNTTEATRSVVARRSDSVTVTIPAPDPGPISSLTDAELEALAVELVQAAPS